MNLCNILIRLCCCVKRIKVHSLLLTATVAASPGFAQIASPNWSGPAVSSAPVAETPATQERCSIIRFGNNLTVTQSMELSHRFPDWPRVRESKLFQCALDILLIKHKVTVDKLYSMDSASIASVLESYFEHNKLAVAALDDLRLPNQKQLLKEVLDGGTPELLAKQAVTLYLTAVNKSRVLPLPDDVAPVAVMVLAKLCIIKGEYKNGFNVNEFSMALEPTRKLLIRTFSSPRIPLPIPN